MLNQLDYSLEHVFCESNMAANHLPNLAGNERKFLLFDDVSIRLFIESLKVVLELRKREWRTLEKESCIAFMFVE